MVFPTCSGWRIAATPAALVAPPPAKLQIRWGCRAAAMSAARTLGSTMAAQRPEGRGKGPWNHQISTTSQTFKSACSACSGKANALCWTCTRGTTSKYELNVVGRTPIIKINATQHCLAVWGPHCVRTHSLSFEIEIGTKCIHATTVHKSSVKT